MLFHESEEQRRGRLLVDGCQHEVTFDDVLLDVLRRLFDGYRNEVTFGDVLVDVL